MNPTDDARRQLAEAQEHEPSLPAVGGRQMDCTLQFFERRCLIQLRDEQVKIAPNNALIAALRDAVRLKREVEDMGRRPI